MSGDTPAVERERGPPSPRAEPLAWARSLLARTRVAVRGALGRRDGRATFGLVAGLYLLAYLWGLRHLTLAGAGGFRTTVAADPLSRAFTRRAPFLWEAVVGLEAGPVFLLVSPLNVLLGLGLGALVGVTLAVSVVSWRGPTACRLGAGAGTTAGVPGLVSGVACCGPQLLVVFGLQASAGLVAALQWTVPLAVALLVGTLLWVGSQVETHPRAAG